MRLIIIAMKISDNPRYIANSSSPREVSSTILVVITLDMFDMLPPTMITAPTSDNARPRPVIDTITKSNLVSSIMVFIIFPLGAFKDDIYSLIS